MPPFLEIPSFGVTRWALRSIQETAACAIKPIGLTSFLTIFAQHLMLTVSLLENDEKDRELMSQYISGDK
jgi:hypothetical protein